jgi:DNA-binding transcriptional ArsR family regulator
MVPEPIGAELGDDDRLSLVFGALAHPVRRRILADLAGGDASVAELTQPFSISQRAISKHLSVLERAGLISRGKDAQRRPSHLHSNALRDAHEWLDAYRAAWDERFDRLESLLQATQAKGPRNARKRRDGRK